MSFLAPRPGHGGDLISASRQYGIAVSDWLDLSTGLNPDGYPVPSIPDKYYRRLPQDDEHGLTAIAKAYYGCEHVVAAAGSQQLIQLLPTLRSSCRVAIPDVGYQEHVYSWENQGHSIVHYCAWQPQQITDLINAGDVDCVVLINPSNPTAVVVDVELLLQWQQKLAKNGGWLVIDEAFADSLPERSFARYSHLPGVIVLRSLGKFFGLAGIRVGFALSEEALNRQIATAMGPWSVSGPAQYITNKALQDKPWHTHTRNVLAGNSRWMLSVIKASFQGGEATVSSTQLFVNVKLPKFVAQSVYRSLAELGILIRYWSLPSEYGDDALLRFGLISAEDTHSRQRFQSALSDVTSEVLSSI